MLPRVGAGHQDPNSQPVVGAGQVEVVEGDPVADIALGDIAGLNLDALGQRCRLRLKENVWIERGRGRVGIRC